MLSWSEERNAEKLRFRPPFSMSDLQASIERNSDSLDRPLQPNPPTRHGSLLQVSVACPPRETTCCCCCCCNDSLDKLDDFYESPRNSSPCNDLGYHTLLSRQTPTPTENNSPWSTRSKCSCDTPQQISNVDKDKEKVLATYKGKSTSNKSSYFDKLSDDVILKIFSCLSTNQLCFCAQVCRRWYFLVWEPQLWTTIKLTGIDIHADRALRTLTRLLCRDSPGLCLTVEKVILNGCARLTDRGLTVLARRCPELHHLELRGCSKVTNAGVSELVTNCSNLEYLDLTGCYEVDSIQLSTTSLLNSILPSSSPRQLYLKHLDISDCHSLSDHTLKIILHNCPQLKNLYLRRCVNLSDAAVKQIANYSLVLKELSISDCLRITDFGLYELAKLGSNLRYLSVAKCSQISDAGIKHIARYCYKLRYLNVRGCEAVSDDSMEYLARGCPRLRALDIGKCDVTDYGLKMLSEHCPNLKKLSVKSCDLVTDKGIQSIAYYCRGLQQLNIQDCLITIEGYKTVKKLCRRCIIEHTNPGFY